MQIIRKAKNTLAKSVMKVKTTAEIRVLYVLLADVYSVFKAAGDKDAAAKVKELKDRVMEDKRITDETEPLAKEVVAMINTLPSGTKARIENKLSVLNRYHRIMNGKLSSLKKRLLRRAVPDMDDETLKEIEALRSD